MGEPRGPDRDRVFSAPRRLVLGLLVVVLLAASGCSGRIEQREGPSLEDGPLAAAPSPVRSPSPAPSASRPASGEDPGSREEEPAAPAPPSTRRRLKLKEVITGEISPKSVVASGTGLFFAQNMMYRHTVTVYDRRGRLVRTIPDQVDLSAFGFRRLGGIHRGAPVEAAFSPDGRYAYVSNYSMYGPAFAGEGRDSCSPASGYHDSFLYRIDTSTLEIDQVIRVGSVPKFVAVSPDGRFVLVTNWCSYSVSVISVKRAKEVRRIDLGPYPRGIAVSPDSRTAYVAVMGSTSVAAVDLDDFGVEWIGGVGSGPRHLTIDPRGRYLYVTLNRDGTVGKLDLRTGTVVARAHTGSAPRSMDIADDGRSLYVVNYHSNTMSKVRARDMKVLQTVPTNHHPIGITYDHGTRQVWVACYSGSIMVFADR